MKLLAFTSAEMADCVLDAVERYEMDSSHLAAKSVKERVAVAPPLPSPGLVVRYDYPRFPEAAVGGQES